MSTTTIPETPILPAGVPAPIVDGPTHVANFVLPGPETRPRATPESDPLNCEFVNGQWMVKPMSTEARIIASRIHGRLAMFLAGQPLGEAVVECLFPIPSATDPRRARQPGVAYVSVERWPKTQRLPATDPWPVVPDLVVEVLSPTNQHEAMQQKLAEYFAVGVRQAWVVTPSLRRIDIHDSPTAIRVFTGSDTLDAGPVLPGFQVPLDEIFGAMPAET